MKFKYGVLDFRYNHFSSFKENLEKKGAFSVNIGDNMQTIAVRLLYKSLGIADDQIISINRDDLPNYKGEAAVLIMNGCLYEPCLPIPGQIIPIFVGLNASERLIERHSAYFRKYEPIGCRDQNTTAAFTKHGIKAYTTGCLTLTLPKREAEPADPKIFIVHGHGAGKLPETFLSYVPKNILDSAEFIVQRRPMKVLPLGDREVKQAEDTALSLLKRYKEEAALVITPLLHVASPCIALGIPVILARKDHNVRFTAISKILPVYTPEKFSEINWKPEALDVEKIKWHMIELTSYLLKKVPEKFYHANALSNIYGDGFASAPVPRKKKPVKLIRILKSLIPKK
jgi:hypothetical protein